MATFIDSVRRYFGARSIYEGKSPVAKVGYGRDVNDPQVVRLRQLQGGALSRPGNVAKIAYLEDLDDAIETAELGNLQPAAALVEFAKLNGTLSGLLKTRVSGLLRLPKKWSGDDNLVSILKQGIVAGASTDDPNSLFDFLVPSGDAEKFITDALLIGVAVAELVPTDNGPPLFVHLDVAGCRQDIASGQWVYQTPGGPVPIEVNRPYELGKSRFVLYTAGRSAPWRNGIWRAVVKSAILIDHAVSYQSIYAAKHSTPARVGTVAAGADRTMKQSFFQSLFDWTSSPSFVLDPAYDIKLLESNGVGMQIYTDIIEHQTTNVIYLCSGSTVLADGGSGFQNASVFRSIRVDLIQADAIAWCHVLNFQVLPVFGQALKFYNAGVSIEYVSTPPSERAADADALIKVGQALSTLQTTLGARLDITTLCQQYSIPLVKQEALGLASDNAIETTGETVEPTDDQEPIDITVEDMGNDAIH
jgi:hypothetical protein